MEPIQISTEPATSNTTTSPVVDDVQEVEDTSNFFSSADDNSENAAENTTPVAEEAEEAEEESDEEEEEEEEEEDEEEEEEEDESETRNINAIANIVGSAASDSSFARKLYKGLCCMKDLIESLEARGVVFDTEEDEEDTADEEDEEEEEEEEEEEKEAEEKVETPLFNTAPAVPKVEPLPNAESILGTEIPLNSAEKPAVANESLTPTAPPAEGGKSVLNTLTGFLTGKTPIFSKTRRNKNRRVNKA
jgi:hypothetical protein